MRRFQLCFRICLRVGEQKAHFSAVRSRTGLLIVNQLTLKCQQGIFCIGTDPEVDNHRIGFRRSGDALVIAAAGGDPLRFFNIHIQDIAVLIVSCRNARLHIDWDLPVQRCDIYSCLDADRIAAGNIQRFAQQLTHILNGAVVDLCMERTASSKRHQRTEVSVCFQLQQVCRCIRLSVSRLNRR